ncbi:hypothetical protein ACH5RR_003040 [Cinchona calisaya]|uniref:Uncharacterized protein n=1 Tax=Cinchona calisaya TaxID=153742 RepID=A0ABD3ATT8_9GENT
MNIVARNTRGLNDPLKHIEVRNIAQKYNIHILGLLENKVRGDNISELEKAVLPNYSFFHNSEHDEVARVWFCWKPEEVNCNLVSIHHQAITCSVKHKDID